MASAFTLPADFIKRTARGNSWVPYQQIQGNSEHRRPISSSFRPRILAQNTSAWNTLDGKPPLVIARGGSSGLFPDQTPAAYVFAATFSLPSFSALMCDLQMTKDGIGICRTGIDLGLSTTVSTIFPNLSSVYSVNGVPTKGYFSVDLTSIQALENISATQPNQARSPNYDGMFLISTPEDVAFYANNSLFVWINVEYANFFSQHKLDMSSYVLALLVQIPVDYISSPEIAFLKEIKAGAPKNTPKLVLRFLGKEELEPSTNVTYGSLLTDLKTIATYASGILVPKDYIWPVDNKTSYLGAESDLIRQAHTAGLAIYASDFVNDPVSPIYNYSFDPVQEYLQYVPVTTGPNVDGFLTDFPATASEALACFRSTGPASRAGAMPFVISHNGDSGNFPGCTLLAYESAVRGGASHIDCPVQMTRDGIPICRESPNLLTNTDVATHTNFFPLRSSTITQLQATSGLFSFNMTWAEIQTLKAKMNSPEHEFGIERNQAYKQESIIKLADFLSYAKNTSLGILVDIQNGYFLETEIGLNVVGSVLASLNEAGLNASDRIVIQSEDSAVLRRIQQSTNYTLVYRVKDTGIIVTKTEVAEVKALANYVTLPRGLVQVSSSSFLLNKTDIVDEFHAQNVSVFLSYLRNEFVTLPFDYEADPILELNTLVLQYKVDGLITDFPATATAYLSNSCSNLKTQATTTGLQYSIRTVLPGDLVTNLPPQIPPPPPASTIRLNVSDGEVALPPSFSPLPSPTTPQSLVPTSNPAPSSSAAFRCSEPNILALLIAAILIGFCHFQ